MGRKWTQNENYLHTPSPSTPSLKLSSLSDPNILGIYRYAWERRAKRQTVESVVTRLLSIVSQKQGRETIISYTILPAEHSGKPSSYGYSGTSNQLTNPIDKIEVYLVEMQNLRPYPRPHPRPPESEATV